MHQVTPRARRIWGLTGLLAALPLAAGGGWLITTAGDSHGPRSQPTATRVITVAQPVTTLNVQSYGAPVLVNTWPVHRVQVFEAITYDPQDGTFPVVTHSVRNGTLTLAAPECEEENCNVGFTVSVPRGVAVAADTQGGSITLYGTANANLDSGGGPVNVSEINGHLIVATEGGALSLNGLTGPLVADTSGGSVLATGVGSAAASVITGGGWARIGFTRAPSGVFISTDGGAVALTVPGVPYALNATTYGGPQTVRIATDPAAGRSITVTTGGGPLQIKSAG